MTTVSYVLVEAQPIHAAAHESLAGTQLTTNAGARLWSAF
jgi:hypothetical protein